MTTQVVEEPRVKQLVDWSASIWAGLVAGLVFLIFNMFVVAGTIGYSAFSILRFTSAIALGPRAWENTGVDPLVLIVGLLIHFVLAILFAMIVAFCIHRWGLIVGIIGGALLGLCLYYINFFSMVDFFQIFRPLGELQSTPMLISHLIYGALAGGIYEALEIEEFITVEE